MCQVFMVDQIASTRNREDLFIIFKPFYCDRESVIRAQGLILLELHEKPAKLVITCGITIFPNLFSTYSYICAYILMTLFNPDNYRSLYCPICLDFFQFGDFLFFQMICVESMLEIRETEISGDHSLLDYFQALLFVTLTSIYRQMGTWRIRTY